MKEKQDPSPKKHPDLPEAPTRNDHEKEQTEAEKAKPRPSGT